MTESERIKYLRVVLFIAGLVFCGLWRLTIVWPSGWAWHTEGRSQYLEMIFGVYATLGVPLMIASRDPMAHKSLSGSRFSPVSCMGNHGCSIHRRHSAHPAFMGKMSWP